MNKERLFDIIFIVFFIIIMIGTLYISDKESKENYDKGYRDACVDFYKGKLKMDLIQNPDGTRDWKWINKK